MSTRRFFTCLRARVPIIVFKNKHEVYKLLPLTPMGGCREPCRFRGKALDAACAAKGEEDTHCVFFFSSVKWQDRSGMDWRLEQINPFLTAIQTRKRQKAVNSAFWTRLTPIPLSIHCRHRKLRQRENMSVYRHPALLSNPCACSRPIASLNIARIKAAY